MEVKNRSKYTKEFKIEALELARSLGSYARAERQLGLSEGILYYWKKKYGFSVTSGGKSAQQAVAETEEVRRLRKENEELRKTNYILKKAAAFFSQDHLK
jgi:transposase